MIEVVYRQEKKDREYKDTGLKLPKNIKQIGDGDADIQVYMEDNVALYLARVPDGENDIRYGVMLGSVKKSCGYTYIFINGAVDVRDVFDNTVLFSDDIWTGLNDDISRYFPGLKVVGWFLSQNGSNANQNMWIKKMHLNNFAGMDKVFYKIDRDEDEESFYYYGKEQLERMGCYHIYYEKNPEMIRYVEETGADMRFKRAGYGETKSGVISRVAERRAEKIKNNINSKTSAEEVTDTENADNKEEHQETKDLIKYSGRLKKAASFFVICGLAGVLGFMGMNGQLNNLADGFTNIVDNIMHSNDEPAGGTGIISVNGVPSGNNNNEINTTMGEENTTEPENNNETESPTEETKGEEATTVENTPADSKANEETTTNEENEATASVLPASTRSYPVEKGDTLYSICMKLYGNTSNIDTIIELNNLESADDIYYGKNLIVP